MPPSYLMIRGLDGAIETRPLDERQAVRIGRSVSADIQLDHEQISRLHAQLRPGPDQAWQIEDLGSRNGTWIDGYAINHPVQLAEQRVVQLGPFDLWLQQDPHANSDLPQSQSIHRLVDTVIDEGHTTIQQATQAIAGIDLAVLDQLHALSLSLAETESVLQRMQAVCQFVRGQSRLVRCCAVLGVQSDDPDSVTLLHVSANDPAEQPYVSRTLVRQVMRDQRPLFMSTRGSAESSELMLSIAEDTALAAFACPMLDRPGGPMLYVLFAAESYDAYWQSLLQLVVSHYRHADVLQRLVDQARIDRELSTAREIQLGLVPRALDDLPLDIAIGFQPCHEVGGDYADALRLPDGRVLITLADVTGKGMPAAMISSSVHTLVHTVADAGGGLIDIAERLNNYMIQFAPSGAFVTGVLLTIDSTTGQMQLINAGHMPPLIAAPGPKVTPIDQGHFMPFGIDKQEFKTTHATLAQGQRLVLYSDGYNELATPDGEMPGIEGVQYALEKHTAGSAADTAEGMKAWATQLAGETPTSDDQTLMVARLRPDSPSIG